MRKAILSLILFLMMTIGSGCLSLFQPINKMEKEFTFIEMGADGGPTFRLAKSVRTELLEKIDGKWTSIGTGVVPAGAYLKGRAPSKIVDGK